MLIARSPYCTAMYQLFGPTADEKMRSAEHGFAYVPSLQEIEIGGSRNSRLGEHDLVLLTGDSHVTEAADYLFELRAQLDGHKKARPVHIDQYHTAMLTLFGRDAERLMQKAKRHHCYVPSLSELAEAEAQGVGKRDRFGPILQHGDVKGVDAAVGFLD